MCVYVCKFIFTRLDHDSFVRNALHFLFHTSYQPFLAHEMHYCMYPCIHVRIPELMPRDRTILCFPTAGKRGTKVDKIAGKLLGGPFHAIAEAN